MKQEQIIVYICEVCNGENTYGSQSRNAKVVEAHEKACHKCPTCGKWNLEKYVCENCNDEFCEECAIMDEGENNGNEEHENFYCPSCSVKTISKNRKDVEKFKEEYYDDQATKR